MAALITVKAPEAITEIVVGIPFVQGVAQVDPEIDAQRRALSYFRRRGYVVEEPAAPAEPVEPAPVIESGPSTPTRSASKADWVAYVTHEDRGTLRLMPEAAEALTRDQLAEKYLGPKED
jgi:hypothetical protein